MKFAIRDDDLNYFYTPEFIESKLGKIWEICPVSMSAIPFVKGNWPQYTKILETLGPNNVPLEVIRMIRYDNKVYDIAENKRLVRYIKEKISEGKIYLTIHGIHHRNEDQKLPKIKNNFSIGAEFYTDRDLTLDLRYAKTHLEKTFGQKITVFTPPQNIYNVKGLKAILNNNLCICGYMLPPKYALQILHKVGLKNYLNWLKFKIERKGKQTPYPFVIKSRSMQLVEHRSLQPGTNVDELYEDFEYVYYKNGCFVLSTHSYGFDYKMKLYDKTLGEVLIEFLNYVAKKDNIEFVTLDKIFI